MASTKVKFEYYRPGLMFLSNSSNLQYFIRGPEMYANPHTGEREQIAPAIMAEFGDQSLSGREVADAEGTPRADIRGGAFDLDETAKALEWGDDIKEMVARKMLRALEDSSFRDFWLYEAPVPKEPWNNYDVMEPEKILEFAQTLGLVGDAINYERHNQNRVDLIAGLEDLIEEPVSYEEQ